jgi:spore germination protein (amino acid permease)
MSTKERIAVIKGGKISAYEGVKFITLLIMSKILYTSPSVLVKSVGTAAWYSTIISCIVSIIFFLLLCILMKRFPGKNLIEVFEAVLGELIGKSSGVIFSGFLIYYTASGMREFVEMIKVYNLPDTAISVILITFMAVIMLTSFKEFKNIIRLSCLNFYPIMFGLFLILVLAIPYYNVDYLKPYFGYGIKKSMYIGFLRASAYQEFMTLPIIISSIHNYKDFKKIGLISIVISGVIFSATFICYLMVFQYTLGRENLSGIFQLSRIIYYSRYFQRIESIFIFIWVIASLLNASTSFYLSMRLYCQSFKIPDHRPLIPAFALLTYVVALMPKNISELIGRNMLFIRQYSAIFVYGLPLLVLMLALVFKKKGESNND